MPLTAATDDVPVVLVLALGHDAARLDAWAEELSRAQLLAGGFRPYWLTDSADIALLRRYGWVVDSVVSRKAWATLRPAEEYDAYVRRRVRSAVRNLGCRVVALHGEPPTAWEDRFQLGLSLSGGA